MASVLAAPAAAAAPPASLPDAGDVVRAWSLARGWLDAFTLPGPESPEASHAIGNASGVCVVLRRSGRVVGVGRAAGGGPLMLRRAAGAALGDALGNPAIAGLPPALREASGRLLTLELEIAGTPRPLAARRFRDLELEPGLEAVALRRGDRWAMCFPNGLRITNREGDPAGAARGLALDLELAPDELGALIERHGVSIYAAPTTALAQAEPEDAPFPTVRGQQIIPGSAVTTRSIAALADLIARRIIAADHQPPPEMEPPRVGFLGDYHPISDRYDPLLATPMEQALLALALLRYADAPYVDGTASHQAATAARTALWELAVVESGEDDPLMDLGACAAVIYAAAETTPFDDGQTGALIEQALQRVHSSFRAERGFVEPDGKGGERLLDRHGQALLAGALSRHLRLRGEASDDDRAMAREALDLAWSGTAPHHLVGLLPWIAWAEIDYAAATSEPLRNRAGLEALRDLLDASRAGAGEALSAADVAGGFILAGSGAGSVTAQTLRPAAAMATLLGVPDARSDDRAAAADLGRHLRTMRYVMQLTVRPECTWSVRNPQRAIGGVRAATWDSRQPAAAQAMGLLVATETLHAIAGLAEKAAAGGS